METRLSVPIGPLVSILCVSVARVLERRAGFAGGWPGSGRRDATSEGPCAQALSGPRPKLSLRRGVVEFWF